jgi:hypothetical protein
MKKHFLETENTLKSIQVKLYQQDTTSSVVQDTTVGPATDELVYVLRAAHTTILKDCFSMADGWNQLLDKVAT